MKAAILILLAIFFVFASGWVCGAKDWGITHKPAEFILPDRVELQEYLNEQGYSLKIDGRIGPKTLEAWDELTGNRHAAKIFKEAGEI